MSATRMVIYGNAGSGKTTMARAVAREQGVPHLSLDDLSWEAAGVRKPLGESLVMLHAFIAREPGWVIEGCYGDLVEAALPFCSELRFLNPGIEACVRNCHSRPWEPSYCSSPEEQARFLEPLIEFMRQYATREDEFSLTRHRAIFESFAGPKQEFLDWKNPTE